METKRPQGTDESVCDFIAKLGGSAITDKRRLETLRPDQLTAAALALAKSYHNGRKFVVVHGAGSFGHHHAKDFAVNSGFAGKTDAARVREGFSRTRLSVSKLNQHVVSALVEHGVPAVALPPCGSWVTTAGVVTADGTAGVVRLLREGFVPCLHGDCVLDENQGCRILSGDTILRVLSRELGPRRVVFLTDVQGIYTKPPDLKGARLLPEIRVDGDGALDIAMETSCDRDYDVTGGVRLKLAAAAGIVADRRGDVVVIVCDRDGFAGACETGEDQNGVGTVVRFKGDS